MQKLSNSEFFQNDNIVSVLPRIPQEPFPEHSHEFHELVLVKSGCGLHVCDGKATHVIRGSVLYLQEQDEVHSFEQMENLCLTNVLFLPSELRSNVLRGLLQESCSSRSGQFIVTSQVQARADLLLDQINQESHKQDEHSHLMIELLLSQLAVTFWRARQANRYDEIEEQDKLQALIHYIDEHYQTKINWSELSDKFAIPLRSMNRKIQDATGLTPNNYLGRVRLCHASYLLARSQETVTDIAFSCGFNDSNYFSSKFSQTFNLTPLQYRKRYHPS